MSTWKRQRRLIEPPKDHPLWKSHCQYPVVQKLSADLWRLHFVGRDMVNRSNGFCIDLNPLRSMQVIKVHEDPTICIGDVAKFGTVLEPLDQMPIGTVETAPIGGIGFSDFIEIDGEKVAFGGIVRPLRDSRYSVELIRLDAPNTTGRLAEDTILRRLFQSDWREDSIFVGGKVLPFQGGYKMWLAHGIGWNMACRPNAEPHYDIKQAYSKDGYEWVLDPKPVIAVNWAAGESGHTGPTVIKTKDGYEIWYCTRGRYDDPDPSARHYTIGYAVSKDGERFERKDSAFVFSNPPQPGDWDYDMQAYPFVAQADDGELHMFYVGNGYGQAGLGYATRIAP